MQLYYNCSPVQFFLFHEVQLPKVFDKCLGETRLPCSLSIFYTKQGALFH